MRRLALAALCSALNLDASQARTIQLSCTMQWSSGERERHIVHIDTDRGIARDGDTLFTNGATSPLQDSLQQFVTVDDHVAMLGQRVKTTKLGAGIFTIGLASGTYAFTSRFRGTVGEGKCRSDDGSI